MVYMDTNKSNTHADPLLGSRWAQMWVHMWAQTLVIFFGICYQGNTCRVLFHCEISHHGTSVKEQNWLFCTSVKVYIGGLLLLTCRQLKFSLCSGAVTTKVLAIVVVLYYPLSLVLWSILCIMPLA